MRLISSYTDIGKVRSENQDHFGTGSTVDEKLYWAVVCDGMGGHAGGSIASHIAVDSAAELIDLKIESDLSDKSLAQILKAAAVLGNSRILRKAAEESDLFGMGTTYVAVAATDKMITVSHSGDSRCCLISKGVLTRLTKDHSLVQMLVDSSEITEEEAISHPRRNIITHALGVEDIPYTEEDTFEFGPGDAVLLCTDGLTGVVSDEDIAAIITANPDSEAARRLVDAANEAGGPDNITAVVIFNIEEDV